MDRLGARQESWYRWFRGKIRSGRKLVRSVPGRIRNAARAFTLNAGPTTLRVDEVGGFHVAHRVGSADDSVLTDSFDGDKFFTRVPEYTPQPTDVILDVGAHIGTFSLLAATKVPRGRVLAVEACAESCLLAKLNVDLNQLTNVEVAHLALAAETGTARLAYNTSGGNWGHSITKQFSRHGEVVRTETLESFLASRGVTTIDFAKFNCEGAEFPILLSSPPELLSRIRTLLVLYHCDLAAGYHQQDLLDHLARAGFEMTIRNQGKNRGWIVARRSGSGTMFAPRQSAA